jgi:hypothetical protein
MKVLNHRLYIHQLILDQQVILISDFPAVIFYTFNLNQYLFDYFIKE